MGSSGLAAAILDFRLPVTSDGVCNSAIVFLDPENMGVAVGIILLSCLQAEICLGVVSPPPPRSRRTLLFSVHGTKVNGVSNSPKTANTFSIGSRMTDFKRE